MEGIQKVEAVRFLEREDRTIGQAAIAGILADPLFATVLPTCVNVEEVEEYAAATDHPLTTEEAERVSALFADNFGIVNRYEMPLKASR